MQRTLQHGGRSKDLETYVKPFALDRISWPPGDSLYDHVRLLRRLYDLLVNVQVREIDRPLRYTNEHTRTRDSPIVAARTMSSFNSLSFLYRILDFYRKRSIMNRTIDFSNIFETSRIKTFEQNGVLCCNESYLVHLFIAKKR